MSMHTGVKRRIREFIEAGGQDSVLGLMRRFGCSRDAAYWALYQMRDAGICGPLYERVRGYGAPNHRNRMEQVWGRCEDPARVAPKQLVKHALRRRTPLEQAWGGAA